METNSIQAIDKKSVHQICSGQVVLDLATAAKELVENSLDAGATIIEIKTKEYGKQLIEVTDNGSGIHEKDFEALALKHFTSKIREFDDVAFVDTYGFRGEALSSLSALSDVVVTTKQNESNVGTRLEFDHNGKLTRRAPVAHSQGTTVTIENIFYTLPVRQKEFHRNYKKEFSKLAQVLYAFSLIHSDIRFTFSNLVGKKKNMLLSTNGKNDILYNVSNIFGSSQAKNITPIEQALLSEQNLEENDISSKIYNKYGRQFIFTGYISKVTHGCGRSTPDRQFFYINKRPCDFPKLSRVINEVYHGFNRHQYPFVLLDISMNRNFADVNVTPDKRMIMVQQEKLLLTILKHMLKIMFDKCATCFVDNTQNTNFSPSNIELSSGAHNVSDFDVSSNQSTPITKNLFSQIPSVTSPPKPVMGSLERFRSRYNLSGLNNTSNRRPTLTSFFRVGEKKRKMQDVDGTITDGCSIDTKKSCPDNTANINNFVSSPQKDYIIEKNVNQSPNPPNKQEGTEPNFDFDVTPDNSELCFGNSEDMEKSSCLNITIPEQIQNGGVESVVLGNKKNIKMDSTNDPDVSVNITSDIEIIASYTNSARNVVTVPFDMKLFAEKYKTLSDEFSKMDHKNGFKVPSFRAKISPVDNKTAEDELDKHVSKEMFQKMDIVGQFNLGFIITKLQNDLFIIDQHATDEKYNFETLQEKRCLKSQKLIQPISLELTMINRTVLLDNIEIFKKNGFDFSIDNDQQCVEIKLTKVPTCRNWMFSNSDVEELIYMLSDSPGTMCRPSRVQQMFASRACRTSVMVGTALGKQAMKKLVAHMGEIKHPWNCPHGRPTMRHLINLLRVSSLES